MAHRNNLIFLLYHKHCTNKKNFPYISFMCWSKVQVRKTFPPNSSVKLLRVWKWRPSCGTALITVVVKSPVRGKQKQVNKTKCCFKKGVNLLRFQVIKDYFTASISALRHDQPQNCIIHSCKLRCSRLLKPAQQSMSQKLLSKQNSWNAEVLRKEISPFVLENITTYPCQQQMSRYAM